MGGEPHGKAAEFWRALVSLLAQMEPLHTRRESLRATLVAPVLYTLDHRTDLQERQAGPRTPFPSLLLARQIRVLCMGLLSSDDDVPSSSTTWRQASPRKSKAPALALNGNCTMHRWPCSCGSTCS